MFLAIEFLEENYGFDTTKMVYNYSVSFVQSRTSLSDSPANILFTLQKQILIEVGRCSCNEKL